MWQRIQYGLRLSDRSSTSSSVALISAALLWGAAPVATRFLSHASDAQVLLAYRFFPSTVAVVLYYVLRRTRPVKGSLGWGKVAALSVVGGLGYNGLVTLALVISPATIVGIALTTEPIWILLLEAFRREKGFSWQLLSGFGLATAGTIVSTVGATGTGSKVIVGVVLAVLGTLCWAIYTVFGSRWTASAIDKTSFLVLFSLPFVVLFLLVGSGVDLPMPRGLPGWSSVVAISLGSTVIAMAGWNYGAAKIGAKRAAPFLYLQPASTVGLSALLLKERPSVLELVGLAAIIVGLIISQSRTRDDSK